MRPATLDTINSAALIGFAEVGRDGIFIAVNQTFAAIVEFSRFEMEGQMTFQKITHRADLDADVAQAEAVAAGKISSYTINKRYVTKLDNVVWVKLRVSGVFDGDVFSHFAVQAQPIMRFQPPQLAPDANRPIGFQPFKWLKANWQIFAAGTIAVGTITAEVIRQISRGGPHG